MILSPHRWRSLILVLAMLLATVLSLSGGLPRFVEGDLFPSNEAVVQSIHETRSADVLLLEGGLSEGFAIGMMGEIRRDGERVGDVVVTDAFLYRNIALVTRLAKNASIRVGDVVRIKTQP